MDHLSKKYGLLTSIAMVVGIVIGSGIFFKADDVLVKSGNSVTIALLAWVIGALGMIFGAQVFGMFAGRYEKSNGIVDYTEALLGETMGYLAGWFMGVLYYTPLAAVLSWVGAMYTLSLFGVDGAVNNPLTWVIAVVYIIGIFVMNVLSPILAGKFQVSTMIIKLIPLGLIALVGTIAGLSNGVIMNSFKSTTIESAGGLGALSTAVVACAFAYEGWIVAVSINEEIIDAKVNLPKALYFGTGIIFLVYVSYFLGMNGVLSPSEILENGDQAVTVAASKLFGDFASTLLMVGVVISVLGTLNGLILASIRSPYSLALRNHGPLPSYLKKVDDRVGMPLYSAFFAIGVILVYLLVWYGNFNEWFKTFVDISELPIVLIYALYIVLYVTAIIKLKDLHFMKRFVTPVLAIVGASFVLYGGLVNPSISTFLIISAVIIALGLVFYRPIHAKNA